MPSKGASRTTNQSTMATIAPVGPAVVVRPSSTQAVLVEPAPIQAVVGAPLAAGAVTEPARAQAVPAAAFVPDIEDPAVDTPEWAAICARCVERHRNERERIDREQAEAQQVWEQSSRPRAQRCPKASGPSQPTTSFIASCFNSPGLPAVSTRGRT
jgi:hypothetical protein